MSTRFLHPVFDLSLLNFGSFMKPVSRLSIRLIFLVYLLVTGVSVNAGQPNIVLITADDMGRELGCYGDPAAKTPNMDRIAAEGVLFENGYVTQASCSSSRSSMLTGLYPHQNGQLGLSHRGYELKSGVPLLPNLLHEVGYYTMALGKVHVEPDDALHWDARFKGVHNTTIPSEVERETKRLLKSAEASGKPFFFMFNLFDPHRVGNDGKGNRFYDEREKIPAEPFESNEVPIFPVFGEVDTPAIRNEIRGYYNSVLRVDYLVGLLRRELEERGQ